ncbi:transcriptional regulator GutM [Escherichia coli]
MPDALRSSGIRASATQLRKSYGIRAHHARRRYRRGAQLALGGWQISRFNRAFDTLCQQGRVGVGRSSGRLDHRSWSPSRWTIEQRIVDTLFMKGLTVFARPQKIPAITGMHAGDLQPDVIFP